MPKVTGFTLIELLIVISIMSILGIAVFINIKESSQDQILNKAIGQIQTLLRQAQSNATAGVLCNSQAGASWSVQLKSDGSTIELDCTDNNLYQKTISLEKENVQISSVQGSSCTTAQPISSGPLYIKYASLNGQVSLIGSTACIGTSSTVTINLINVKKSSSHQSFTISKGGALNVK